MIDEKRNPSDWKKNPLPDETPGPMKGVPPFTDEEIDGQYEKEKLEEADRLKNPHSHTPPYNPTSDSATNRSVNDELEDDEMDLDTPDDAGNLDIYQDRAGDEAWNDESQGRTRSNSDRASGLVGTHDLGEESKLNPDETMNRKL